ncbi:MAG TPA: aromatic ring-hydroxylating dioxygenase subunit alpha, partial [Pyrinomonadaceae bacterium]|nr:aromatic ring-hydroxylating dioxygenase subunit alpha [Pyrinomonadaceae bacterium]
MSNLRELIAAYDASASLDHAFTIPASWYTSADLYHLELNTVFAKSWQLAGRIDQVTKPGRYVTSDIGAEPIVVVRGNDTELRGFYNVCRHHAAAVMIEPEGEATQLRCPYHGWTYSLSGELKGTPDFSAVCNFERSENSLIPINVAQWENWVFVQLQHSASLPDFLTQPLIDQISPLNLQNLHWMERRYYSFDCNWKVFVDNYLDGGYHVP